LRAIHLPVWIGSVSRPRATTFATLFALLTFCRALLITVVPLSAHSLLGDAQKVSMLYFGVSGVGVCGALAVPLLVYRLKRRWVFSLGAVAMAFAAFFLSLGTFPGLVLGMIFQVFSIACMEITFNLYLMDHIPRTELGRFEPLRMFFASGSWIVGPWLGVYLQRHLVDWAPFALSAAAAVVMLGFFWFLRLTEDPAVAPAKSVAPNPIRYLPHFFVQPRLRLAWVLALARSGWWAMFFIYALIYCVTAGLGEVVGGAIASVASASLFIVPLWGWVGRRYGLRRLLLVGYCLSALASFAVAAAAGVPWLGAAALLAAAFSTGTIDGGGNVPFLRAVHPLERAEMTTVFATYRDVSQLAPPGIFALILKVFELPAVFIAAGGAMLVVASYARYLPRRL
jgi:MFS family permease